MDDVLLAALDDRPRFAAKMVAVWRWHHMKRGDELAITIHPGEWPTGVPMEVKGVPIQEHPSAAGGPGGMLALGRAGESWRWAYQVAIAGMLSWAIEPFALVTVYGEVADDRSMKIWMSPSPATGEVPMWLVRKDRDR